ncbi:MAG: ribosome maturation factor RimM [Acutalibacteraceae bacterium]
MLHCPKAAILYRICWACVYNADDETICYGAITDVIKTGANDVYQITDKQQKNYLIPVIDQVVIDTDIQGRKLLIRPMKGIFEDED